MRRLFNGVLRMTVFAAAGTLAACTSSLPDFSQFKLPSTRNFLPVNSDTYVPPVSADAFKPVGPGDLVDAQGVCAGAAPAQSSDAGVSGAAPGSAAHGSVGLDMTECEVVSAMGPPQSVSLGASERGDRKVTMIYTGNERAGTYQFVSGRLTSLERGPDAPSPEKPAKKKPASKKQAQQQPAN